MTNILSYPREGKVLNNLREAYFAKLEHDCVEFTEREDIGLGYSISKVKEEYATATVEEMIDYLGMPDWVAEWTKEVV